MRFTHLSNACSILFFDSASSILYRSMLVKNWAVNITSIFLPSFICGCVLVSVVIYTWLAGQASMVVRRNSVARFKFFEKSPFFSVLSVRNSDIATREVVAGSLFTACGSIISCLVCVPAPHPPSFAWALLIQSKPLLMDDSTFSGVLNVLIHFRSWLVSIPKMVFIRQTWFATGLLQH